MTVAAAVGLGSLIVLSGVDATSLLWTLVWIGAVGLVNLCFGIYYALT